MKRLILLSTFISLALTVQAVELEMYPSVKREWGMTGAEFTTNYFNVNRKNKSEADKLKDIYTIIDNTNLYLSKELSKDNFDKDYLFKVDYNYLKAEELKAPSFNFTLAGFYDESNRVGINLTYTDIQSKLHNVDTNGEGYQVSLFWLNSEVFDNSSVFTNIYYGTTKENIKNTDSEYKTNYYGIYNKLEKMYEGFNDFSKGYNIELEAKRIDDKIKHRDEKNTSTTAAVNGIIEKVFFITDKSTAILRITAGYEREFLNNDVYNGIMDSEFKDSLNGTVHLDFKVTEVLDVYSGFELKKSLNTSNNENRAIIGFKLSL